MSANTSTDPMTDCGYYTQGRLLHISNEAACFIHKLGGLKNDAVFDSWGNIMVGLTTTSLCGMFILHLFKFFLLAEV